MGDPQVNHHKASTGNQWETHWRPMGDSSQGWYPITFAVLDHGPPTGVWYINPWVTPMTFCCWPMGRPRLSYGFFHGSSLRLQWVFSASPMGFRPKYPFNAHEKRPKESKTKSNKCAYLNLYYKKAPPSRRCRSARLCGLTDYGRT